MTVMITTDADGENVELPNLPRFVRVRLLLLSFSSIVDIVHTTAFVGVTYNHRRNVV